MPEEPAEQESLEHHLQRTKPLLYSGNLECISSCQMRKEGWI